MEEIRLKSVFGNELRIASGAEEFFMDNPKNFITLVFGEKGIVLEKRELNKLKDFICNIQ